MFPVPLGETVVLMSRVDRHQCIKQVGSFPVIVLDVFYWTSKETFAKVEFVLTGVK